MDLETATLVFLIVVFVAAEIHRSLRSRRGVIVGFEDSDLGFLVSPLLTARVRLNDGSEVMASVNSCTACLGRLAVGTQVRVYNSSDGYVVDTPWLEQKLPGSCGSSRA